MKISVVIPTWNRRHLLATAIDSALAQTAPGLETGIIVVDDGSTDGTAAWLARDYAGQPLRVLANTRAKGPAGARNTGILAADGELVALLDSDDAWLPGHLAAAAAAFAAHPQLGMVFGRARYEQDGVAVDYMGPNFERKLACAPLAFEANGVRGFGSGWFAHLLEYGCYFNLSSVVLRREAARELMNEQLRIAEDYEFWVRLARRWPCACLPDEHIRYRLHDANLSFEATEGAASAAGNAPMQLAAWRLMLDYPGLASADRARIRNHMAGVLFDWGWRCRQQRRLGEAARRHAQALRFGQRARNLLALAKLPLAALRPSGSGETRQ